MELDESPCDFHGYSNSTVCYWELGSTIHEGGMKLTAMLRALGYLRKFMVSLIKVPGNIEVSQSTVCWICKASSNYETMICMGSNKMLTRKTTVTGT